MNTEMKDIQESLHFVIEHMATKDDIAEIHSEMATKDDIVNMATKDDIVNMATKDDIASLRSDIDEIKSSIRYMQADIREIKDELNALTERVDGMKGFALEIDELRTRVNELEKELATLKQRTV